MKAVFAAALLCMAASRSHAEVISLLSDLISGNVELGLI